MLNVRLWGLDATESNHPCGRNATMAAREFANGKQGRVRVENINRYGRAVADLEVEVADLGKLLFRDSYA